MSKVQWLGDVARYTQDFFAYFGGKQVYKATGAYFSKEEGRAQAKQIYGQLAKTNSYGYLMVCIVSKYPTECWDGKTFGAQPPPPEPKCPPGQYLVNGKCQLLPSPPKCPPGTMLMKTNPADPGTCVPVLPPPTHPVPKPTTVGPITAILPVVPRPRSSLRGVQWLDAARPQGRPSTQCPPGYKYSSRWHVCVPAGKGDPLLHGLGLTPVDVATAKGVLVCWSKGVGKDATPLDDYGAADVVKLGWNPRDKYMLQAWTNWWNKSFTPKLTSSDTLDDARYAVLSQHATKFSGGTTCFTGPCLPGQWRNPLNDQCEPVPVAPGGGQAQPQPGGAAPPPIFSPSAPQTVTPGAETAPPPAAPSGGGGGAMTPPPGSETAITKPAPAKSETPWGWILGGVALAGVAGLAIWAGARGVGGAMGAGARSNPKVKGPTFALVKASGLDDTVLSVHKTAEAAEAAMRKRGGEPHSMFTSGMRVVDVGPDAGNEMIEIFGKRTIRPRTSRNNPVPFKNVYWRDIKPEDRVTLEGKPRSQYYVVTKPSGKKLMAYWSGQDAREAQRWLDLKVLGEHRHGPVTSYLAFGEPAGASDNPSRVARRGPEFAEVGVFEHEGQKFEAGGAFYDAASGTLAGYPSSVDERRSGVDAPPYELRQFDGAPITSLRLVSKYRGGFGREQMWAWSTTYDGRVFHGRNLGPNMFLRMRAGRRSK